MGHLPPRSRQLPPWDGLFASRRHFAPKWLPASRILLKFDYVSIHSRFLRIKRSIDMIVIYESFENFKLQLLKFRVFSKIIKINAKIYGNFENFLSTFMK